MRRKEGLEHNLWKYQFKSKLESKLAVGGRWSKGRKNVLVSQKPEVESGSTRMNQHGGSCRGSGKVKAERVC